MQINIPHNLQPKTIPTYTYYNYQKEGLICVLVSITSGSTRDALGFDLPKFVVPSGNVCNTNSADACRRGAASLRRSTANEMSGLNTMS